MPREVVFTHRPVELTEGLDTELVYADDLAFAVIIRHGRSFIVRLYTARGLLGLRIATRHTFVLAFGAATEYGIREGFGL